MRANHQGERGRDRIPDCPFQEPGPSASGQSRRPRPNLLCEQAIYFPSASRKSSTVSPALPRRDLSVPLATSGWFGTERVARCPSFVRIIWLPFCRATSQPSFRNALTTSRGFRRGTSAMRVRLYRRTSTCLMATVKGIPLAVRTSRHSLIACWIFFSASRMVLPWLTQPGI